MSSIREQITHLKQTIPAGVKLVAVSKTHPVEALQQAYDAGARLFGESRPQEMAAKHAQLPSDIEWHMIGHLQRNKVRMIIPFVAMIHSVDSARLLETIHEESARAGRTVDILLEIHIAREESKTGWSEKELIDYLSDGQWRGFSHIRFRGVMGIASNSADTNLLRAEFTHLHTLWGKLRKDYFGPDFDTLSMGMTSDYPLAIECGSTMVRIGSLIFGTR